MENQHQLLSALVVFDSLKKQEKGLQEILKSFIKLIIQDKNLNAFTHIEICESLKSEFGFRIPGSVVEQALKKMSDDEELMRKDKKFYSKNTLSNIQNMQIEIDKAMKEEEKLIDDLCMDIDLLEHKETMRDELINYFLGNTQGEYKKEIDSFIIKNSDNDILKNISNGIILYNGLRYSDTFDNKKWNNLNVYINMEIIFHYIGYNGELFSKIIEELFELITEINRKKKVIYLYYTLREEQRIEDFFEAIIRNKNTEDTEAAKQIKLKCGDDEIKIRGEKARLFKKLKENAILKQDIHNVDFNAERNQVFNIVSDEVRKRFHEIEPEKIEFLNKLNILRANNQATIENSKYIFLTDENEYKEISKYIKESTKSKIPIAIQVVFLTNILWLKLGRLSKNSNELLAFKPDTRAKISIALGFNKHNVSLQKELKQKIEDGMDKDITKDVLYGLISSSVKPEEINETNVDTIIEMSGADLNYFVEQNSLKEKRINTIENENKNLKEQNKKLNEEKEKDKQYIEQLNREKYERDLQDIEIQEADIKRKLGWIKTIRVIVAIALFVIVGCAMYKLEIVNRIFSILIALSTPFVAYIINGKFFFAKTIKLYEEKLKKLDEKKTHLLKQEDKGKHND